MSDSYTYKANPQPWPSYLGSLEPAPLQPAPQNLGVANRRRADGI